MKAHEATDAVPRPAGGHEAPEIVTDVPLAKPKELVAVTLASVYAGVAVGLPVDVPAVTPLTAYVNVFPPPALGAVATTNVPLVPEMLEPAIVT